MIGPDTTSKIPSMTFFPQQKAWSKAPPRMGPRPKNFHIKILAGCNGHGGVISGLLRGTLPLPWPTQDRGFLGNVHKGTLLPTLNYDLAGERVGRQLQNIHFLFSLLLFPPSPQIIRSYFPVSPQFLPISPYVNSFKFRSHL